MESLPPKKIVITGVTKGLGKALIERFHEQGCQVAGCARSLDEIKKLKESYKTFCFDTLDISEIQLVTKWANNILTTMGSPDLLINCASIVNQPARLWEVSAEEFTKVVSINITGYWNVIKAFVPSMVERKKGVIVNFSSGWGQLGAALFGPYCASKFAVEGLTQSLAKELPSGMAAVAIIPGMINTQMLKICVPDIAEFAPTPEAWSLQAAPFILQLDTKDNGKSLAIPK